MGPSCELGPVNSSLVLVGRGEGELVELVSRNEVTSTSCELEPMTGSLVLEVRE